MDPDEAARRFQLSTSKVATVLFEAVKQRAYLRPSFLSLMMFKIQLVA